MPAKSGNGGAIRHETADTPGLDKSFDNLQPQAYSPSQSHLTREKTAMLQHAVIEQRWSISAVSSCLRANAGFPMNSGNPTAGKDQRTRTRQRT